MTRIELALSAPRAALTTWAIAWATDALEHDDTTVSALARHLGVDWHTCWDAVEREATRRNAEPAGSGVATDEHGTLHARLLDVVPGRSGTAYATWLKALPAGKVLGRVVRTKAGVAVGSIQRPTSASCLTRSVDYLAGRVFGACPGGRATASWAGRPWEASASTRAWIASLLATT